MRIYVVGSLTVAAFGAVLHERSLPGGQGRVMLGMLAVEHDRPLSREEIADELWPEGLPRSWEPGSATMPRLMRTAKPRPRRSNLPLYASYSPCMTPGPGLCHRPSHSCPWLQ